MTTDSDFSPLEALATSLAGPFLVLDVDGVVVGATPAAGKLLGQEADALAGRRMSDVVLLSAGDEPGDHTHLAHWEHARAHQRSPDASPDTLPAVVQVRGKPLALLLRCRVVQAPLGPGWMVELTPADPSRQGALSSLTTELQTARIRYRSLFDRIQVCVAVYQAVDDGADFRFTDFNQAAERAEQMSCADVLGQRVTQAFPGVRSSGLLSVLQRVHRTGTPEDWSVKRFNGNLVSGWRDNHVYRLHTGEVVAVYADVTERKRAEEALRIERDHLRQVLDTTQNALLVTDLDGVVTYVSPRASVLFCTPRDQLEGESIDSSAFQLLCPNGRPLPSGAHPLARVLNGNVDTGDDTYGFESAIGRRLLRICASPVLSADHCIAEYVFTIDDITEADHDRRELERAERSLSHAQTLGGVGSWETDLNAGKTWWSQQLYRLFEIDPQCPPPHSEALQRRIHPDDRPVHAAFERRLRDRPGRTKTEFRVKLHDGTFRRMRAFAHHETGPAGSASGRIVGFLQDVTEQRRAEKAHQQARIAAESANRAKTEFLAIMSHELRTPLNAVRGFADLIENSTGEEQTRGYARYVVQGADNLTAIIQDILDLSSIEAGQLELDHEPFAPWGVVGEVSRALKPKATARGLSLRSDIAIEVPPFITGDAQHIRQILNNLVGNAVKFTENGGVSLTVIPTSLRGAPALEWVVEDTGIGIPTDKLARIFDTFTQVDSSLTRPFDGLGLGLSISKRLAELMGGHIHVTSAVGQGSTFRLTLPYDHAAGFEPSPIEPPAPSPLLPSPGSGMLRPLVLVVEDDPINTALILEVLKSLPIDVKHTGNGERAVELARSVPFDAVLMDIQLPGMSGLEATRLIRESVHEPPSVIIGISAHALDQHRSDGLRSGMDLYMSKPILPSVLLRELRSRLALG